MSLIRDALNKAQQEQDAARAGRPVPKFTPSDSRPHGGNGPAAKVFGVLIALGAIMGCIALFLQIFYPMSRGTDKEPVTAVAAETKKPADVAVQITPQKPAPKETPNIPPPAQPVPTPAPIIVPPAPTPTPLVSLPQPPAVPVVVPPVPTPLPPPVTLPPLTVTTPPPVAVALPTPPPAPPVTPPPAVADGPSQDLIEFVDALAIRAVMVRPGGNRVSILGRVFQSGDFLPGAPKPLKLDQITKDTLTFKDNAGHSYTKRL